MIKSAPVSSRSWYRYPFVWLLVALPASAVIGGILTFWIAARTDDGLVADDYYKKGKEINQDLHRDNAAADLGLEAQVMLGADQQNLRVIFNQAVDGPVTIQLMHPTRAGLDQTIVLAPQGPQFRVATLPRTLTQPNWLVEISDTGGKWRLRGEWKAGDGQSLQLKAGS